MKKIVKKIIKGYLLLTVAVWTIVGMSEYYEELDENPNESVDNINCFIFTRAVERYKKFFKSIIC